MSPEPKLSPRLCVFGFNARLTSLSLCSVTAAIVPAILMTPHFQISSASTQIPGASMTAMSERERGGERERTAFEWA